MQLDMLYIYTIEMTSQSAMLPQVTAELDSTSMFSVSKVVTRKCRFMSHEHFGSKAKKKKLTFSIETIF